MARTRKSIQPLNLYKYDVLIEDQGTRSDYFKISQFDGYFYGGRNAFLVAGTNALRQNSKILVEILNKDGNTVYSAPISNFIEGNSRLVQAEVYSDTPIGPGKIVLLGCADTYVDGTPVPTEWKDKYNVRWITDVIISPLVYNKTPIRFAKTPSLIVEEKFYSSPSSSTFSENIQVPIDFSFSPKYYNVFPNGYVLNVLTSNTASEFISDYTDGIITGSVILSHDGLQETASVNLPITKIYNKYTAETQGVLLYTDNKNLLLKGTFSGSGIYTSSFDPIGNVIVNGNINLQYNKLITANTGSSVSFANVRLVDLTTLSGEINKIRLSYKASTQPGEFILLSDVETSVQELLAVDSASKIAETGYFHKVVIGDYWYAATMSADRLDRTTPPPTYYFSSSANTNLTITQSSENLLDSINATPIISNGAYTDNTSYFIGTKTSTAPQLFPRTEYTIKFDAFVSKVSASVELSQNDFSLDVYLIKEPSSVAKIYDKDSKGQLIGTLTPAFISKKQNFETAEFNFVPRITEPGTFGLRFVFYGGFWNVANVSIKPASEPFFSPDEIEVLVPVHDYNESLITFKADFLDVNNNSAGVSILSLPVYFTGSATTTSTSVVSSGSATASYIQHQNPGDNRVITSLGSGSLNGEQNLQFDGSTLSVTGSLVVSGSATLRNIGPAQFSGSVSTTSDVSISGSVGIGTTSPQGKLHVVTGSLVNAHYNNQGAFLFEAPEAQMQIISDDSGNHASKFVLSTVSSSTVNKHWMLDQKGPGLGNRFDISYFTSSNSGNILAPANVEKLTIATDGRVGINTTSSRGLVDIAIAQNYGTDHLVIGTTVPAVTSYPSTPNSSQASFVLKGTTSDARLNIQDGTGRINLYWNAYQSASGHYYTVSSEMSGRMLIHPSTYTAAWNYYGAIASSSGAPVTWIQSAFIEPSGSVWFSPRGTSSDFYINMSGNVGIGTASPAQKLHVVGQGRIDSAGGILILNDTTSGTDAATSNYISFQRGGTEKAWVGFGDGSGGLVRLRNNVGNIRVDASGEVQLWTNSSQQVTVDTAGNVGIGTTSPASLLHINGVGQNAGLQINTVKTYVTERLTANATQARRFEIARIGIDYNDWNQVGVFTVELFEYYYSRGLYKRYVVSYGYNNNSYRCDLVENVGSGDNQFQVTLGTPVLVSGDEYYLPVYVDVKYYSQCDARITTNRAITTNTTPGIGATYINLNPTPSNISDFTPDSQVVLAGNAGAYINGNLGVGTSSPGQKLDVSGADGVRARVVATAGGTSGLILSSAGNTAYAIKAGNADNSLRIDQDGTDRITLASGGNVGVGTTSPEAKLHVSTGDIQLSAGRGSAGSFGKLQWQNNLAYSSTVRAYIEGRRGANDDGYIDFATAPNTNVAPVVRTTIDPSGNVGIGTQSPGVPLQVHGNGTLNAYRSIIRIINTDTGQWGGLAFPDGTSVDTAANNNYFIGRGASLASRTLSFHVPVAADYGSGTQPRFLFASTGADELVTIQASTGNTYIKGNLGIGTTSPTEKLEVNGSMKGGGGETSVYNFKNITGRTSDGLLHVAGNSSTAGLLYLNYAGGTVAVGTGTAATFAVNTNGLYVNTSNNVGIGTTSPGALLHVQGAVSASSYTANGNVVWHAGNDGASSGLDADLLDGNHASAFYLASNPSGYTTNTGTVTSVTVSAGSGMSGGGTVTTSGTITLTNAGVTSAVAGTGISVSGATGAVTITNAGVTSVNGSTGAVTVAATNQTMYIGTTAVAINRSSATLSLTGVNIDGSAGSVAWSNISGHRTQTRGDAGISGSQGARSGFFETSSPVNYYTGASSWQHLIEARHTNDDNNYAMQLAGSFFDQALWFRKTNNSPTTAWRRIVTNDTDTTWAINISGNAANITAYTINQNLGTSNTPTFNYVIFKDSINANTYGFRGLSGVITCDGGAQYPTGWNFQYGGTSTSAMYINSSGNVGIGTTSPTQKLHVYGSQILLENSGNATMAVTANGNVAYMGTTSTVAYVGSSNTDVQIRAGAGTKMFIQSADGNVGINTTSPQTKLHVAGTVSYGSIRISPTSATGESAIAFFDDIAGTDTNDAWVVGHAGWGNTGDFVIGNENNGAGGNVRLLIEKAGNVGIGTTSPSTTLDISGTFNVTSTAYFSGGTYIGSNGDVYARRSAGSTGVYYFADGGSKYLYWDGGNYIFGSAGHVYASTSFRAPIVYDSDNTGYYVDPASTSVFNSVYLANGNTKIDVNNVGQNTKWRTVAGSTDIGISFYDASDRWTMQLYANYGDGYGFLGANWGGWDIKKVVGGVMYLNNNTTYYLNPASTTNLYALSTYSYQGNGNVGGTGNASWHPSGIYSAGYNWLYGGISGGGGSGTNFSDLRAGIFYDFDNTAYYLDPAATTSGLLRGNLRFNDHGAGIVGLYDSYKYQLVFTMGDAYKGSIDGTSVTGGYGLWFSHPNAGGVAANLTSHGLMLIVNGAFYASLDASMRAVTDMRAPTFYDISDTAYYVNPNSGSYLYGLTLSGNSYFRPQNWIQLDSSYGLYWSNHYGAHLQANTISSYTQIALQGNKGSYGGIYDYYSGVNGFMYDSSGNGGVYREASSGRWYFYYHVGNDCMGVGTTGTSSTYSLYLTKGVYAQARIDATIFYDTNNTGYYVDPAGTARLSTIYCGDVYNDLGGWFRNYGATGIYNQSYGNHFYSDETSYWNLTLGGNSSGGLRIRTNHASTVLGYVYADTNYHIGFLNNAGSWRARVVSGDYFLVEGSSARAPLFYDSNDTGYYADPASTSIFNQINANFLYGNIEVATSDNSSTSYSVAAIELRESQRGGSSSYLAPRLGFHWGGVVASQISIESSGRISIINNPGSAYESLIGSILYGNSSVRAPIFYDNDNTAYYVDGASTSILNNVQITTLGVGTGASGTTGEIRATNNVTAYYSDARLKNFIGPIKNALHKVQQLTGYYFTENELAKSLGYNNDDVQVGVSAQEVQEVLPEVVTKAPISDNYLTVRYEKMIPLLIQAIKEQQDQIEQLKMKLNIQ